MRWIPSLNQEYDLNTHTRSRLRILKTGCRIELMLGPSFWYPGPLDASESFHQRCDKNKTILCARRRRFVIHLTPVRLGRNLMKEYPMDLFARIDRASSYGQIPEIRRRPLTH